LAPDFQHFFIPGSVTPMTAPMKSFSWANGLAVSSAAERRFYTPGSILSPPAKNVPMLRLASLIRSISAFRDEIVKAELACIARCLRRMFVKILCLFE
jgi:hypothetical protein